MDSSSAEVAEAVWHVARSRRLTLNIPRLMGVVNATPDSFSDGGDHATVDALIAHAKRMVDEGAAVIDVGGESTRPGAASVDDDEQIARTCPVIQALARASEVLISIDTSRAAVAAAAIEAGAHIINDVSAGEDDPDLLPLAAETGCGLVLMHRARAPIDDVYSHDYATEPQYDDVVSTVARFLDARIDAAIEHGVALESIVIDPGLGFGKSVGQNFELIWRTDELAKVGRPILSAASRKSFIGQVTGVEMPRSRLAGSLAVTLAHFAAGVRLFRVHDLAAHRQALAVATAIRAVGTDPAPFG